MAPRDCHCSAQLGPPLKGLPSRATASRYVFTGPGGCLRWPPTPPGPRWPPALRCNIIYFNIYDEPRAKFFVCSDVPHTHPAFGRVVSSTWGENEDEKGMKMRWKWRWDERILNRDPRRGTQKKREGANTHQHTWPRAGKPWKGKRKEKRRPTEGKTEAPEPTWHSENLRLPRHAQDPTYLGREERMNGGLVGETEKQQQLRGDSVPSYWLCLTPSRDRGQVKPHGHKQLFKFQRIRCTTCSTSPTNHQKKGRPYLESVDLPEWLLMRHVCVHLQKLRNWKKNSFWLFRSASNPERRSFQGITRDHRISRTSQKAGERKGQLFRFT